MKSLVTGIVVRQRCLNVFTEVRDLTEIQDKTSVINFTAFILL